MRGEAMPQRVWMNGFFQTRALGRLLTGMVRRFRVDRVIPGMPAVTGKEPVAGFSPQPAPVLAQFVEQLGTEHDISIYATFAALDVDHHALAVDIAEFQTRQLGAPQASGVEGHEQSAME